MIIKTKSYTSEAINANEELKIFDGQIPLDRENFICIASRPGMGKTSLAIHMAIEFAQKCDKAVYIFSLGEKAESIRKRLIAYLSEVDISAIKQEKLSPTQSEKLSKAEGALKKLNVIINDNSAITASEIEAELEKANNCGMVIIDNIRLLGASAALGAAKKELDESACLLKSISRKHRLPVITTSQLYRCIEYRKNKRPTLSDLAKISSALESEADTVIFPFREEYYNFNLFEHDSCNAEINIAKNAYNSPLSLTLPWRNRFMKFGV